MRLVVLNSVGDAYGSIEVDNYDEIVAQKSCIFNSSLKDKRTRLGIQMKMVLLPMKVGVRK